MTGTAPSTTLAIRRACEADVDAVAPLFDAYRQFYQQDADLSRARDWLRDRIGGRESVVLLAEHNGIPIGFTQLYPMFSSVRTARTWILNDLFVAPNARRSGVARALLDASVRFAHEDGAIGLSLETARDNTAARALYTAAGWTEEHTQWFSMAIADGRPPVDD